MAWPPIPVSYKWVNASAATAYKLVDLQSSADFAVDLAAADTDFPVAVTSKGSIGVAQNEPLHGAIPLVPGIPVRVTASGAITRGGRVTCTTGGAVKAAVSDDFAFAVAAQTAADGDIIYIVPLAGMFIRE